VNLRFRCGGAAVAAYLLAALPALAADPHDAGQAAEAAHESPPLFSVDPGLMIWTIITFVIVLVILRMTAWKPLMEALEARQQSIEGAIEQARHIKAEAEALLAKYETMLASAKDESREILEEARRDGAKVQAEIRERAHQEAEEFKDRAHREIELAKDGALKEIWDQAASLSTELASRILGRTLDGSDQERLVQELVGEMRRELGNGGSPDKREASEGQEREPV
jgi:F-type H+-transporting ATPase subunit b